MPIPYNDPLPGLTMLILLVFGLGLLAGIGLGYRLAWRHIRVQREYKRREADVHEESSALEATEASKPKYQREIEELLSNHNRKTG